MVIVTFVITCEEMCHYKQGQSLGAEVGVVGGFPAAGPLFGAAYNPEAIMPTCTMIDLIQGGNLDAAVLGCAEVMGAGNASLNDCLPSQLPDTVLKPCTIALRRR